MVYFVNKTKNFLLEILTSLMRKKINFYKNLKTFFSFSYNVFIKVMVIKKNLYYIVYWIFQSKF